MNESKQEDMEEMTYSKAMAELEDIIRRIDSGQLEIDEISDRIKRANALISYCTDKLTKADEEIEKLLPKGQN